MSVVFVDPNARKDDTVHEVKEWPKNSFVQLINAAVPFLLMGRRTSGLTTYALSAYQAGMGLHQMRHGDRKAAAISLAHTTTHTALTFFKPAFAPLYSTIFQMVMDIRKGCDKETAARLANHSLFLASLFFKRPEVLAASLFVQAAAEAKEAYAAYRKEGHKVEAAGKLMLAIVRVVAGVGQVQEAYRQYTRHPREDLWEEVEELKTGLSQEEFDAIMDYAEHHEQVSEATRIKGSQEGLPRSITLTPDALYIHLKRKGGMKPLGGGLSKKVYKCLKIEEGHPKLMAELTVRGIIQDALAADRLAKEVGSPFINGGAEVVCQYGRKLCLIEDLMDMNGWKYARHVDGSAADRLKVMEDISRGLGDLHAFGWGHGDLHLGNMLFNVQGEHSAKLSDLAEAYKIQAWDKYTFQWECDGLRNHINIVCGPIWSAFPENESVQALRAEVDQLVNQPGQDTAYKIADALQECRLTLKSGRSGPKNLIARH